MAHARLVGLAALAVCVAGCAVTPNHYAAESPSYQEPLDSPTAVDVKTSYTVADQRVRDWEPTRMAAEPTAVQHLPTYFEDPFEDKGTSHANRLGAEDWLAVAYCPGRFALNFVALPVSMVVTPPWTVMESDGVLSRQALGYDHDATAAPQRVAHIRHTEPVEIQHVETDPTTTAPNQ